MKPLRWRRIAYALWWLAAGCVVGAALLLGVARLVLPTLGGYRSDVERWLSDYLQRPVSVERLDVRWAGFGPQLTLRGLRIAEPGGEALLFGVEEAYVDANLWRFLMGGTAALGDVELNGLRLQVDLRLDGSVAVQGVELWRPGAAPGGEPSGDLLAVFAAPRRIALSGITVQLRDWRDDASYRLQDVRLRLLNEDGRHRLQADLPLPAALGGHLRANLEFFGSPQALAQGGASLYLAARGLRLQPLGRLLRDLPLRAQGGTADARVWLDWNEGALLAASARVDLRAPVLTAGGDDRPWRAEGLAAQVRWRRLDDGWRAQVDDLRLALGGGEWPAAAGEVRLRRDGTDRWLDGSWSYLELAALTRLAELAVDAGLAPPLAGRLLPWQPRGEIRDLRFRLPLAGTGAGAGAALTASFANLGVAAHAGAPGVDGLAGRLWLQGSRGRVDVRSSALSLEFPGLFRAPLQARELTGSIGFDLNDGIALWSPRLLLANDDLRSASRFVARWVAGQPLFVDFQADFHDGDGRVVSRYLPVGIMHPRLVEWLDASVREGRVTRGSAVLYGPVTQFPFREGDGVFQVEFDAEGVALDYQRGWPGVREVAAKVRFAQAGLEVDAHDGTLLGARIGQARARFEDLEVGRLQLEGRAAGEVAQLLRFVRESPLRRTLGPFFEGATGGGAAGVSLRLGLPLRDPDEFDVAGEIALDGARLNKPEFNLDFDRLQGVVNFTGGGIAIDSLAGRLNGRPVDIRAGPLGAGASTGTRLRLRGRFAPREVLGTRLRQLSGLLRGRADWEAEIDLPPTAASGGEIVVRARSDLRGLAVELPAPMDKVPGEQRPFALTLRFADAGRRLQVTFRHAELFAGDLEFLASDGDWSLQRGRVTSGAAVDSAAGERGLSVDIEAAALDLDGWFALAAGWPRDAGGGAGLQRLSLRVDTVVFNRQSLGILSLSLTRAAERWSASIANPAVTGSLEFSSPGAGGGPLVARLQRLDLGALLGEDTGGTSTLDLQPGDLPALKIDVDILRWGDTRLRNLHLSTVPHPRRFAIEELRFDGGALKLQGQGEWRLAGDGSHGSRIDFSLVSEDWGSGLAELGYPGILRGGKGTVTGALDWSAPVYRPALADMQGTIGVAVEDGALLDAEPGLGRFVGLFSIQALPRRLALDFKDFVSEGFDFDQLEGTVELVQGVAYTRGMRLQGTVGRIDVSGSSNLVEQTYAQEVVVTPNLSASLPLVGELAVPGSGITVLLLGTVLKGLGLDIERLGQLQYTLTGPWEAPVMERKQVEVRTGPEDEADKR